MIIQAKKDEDAIVKEPGTRVIEPNSGGGVTSFRVLLENGTAGIGGYIELEDGAGDIALEDAP